MKYWLYRHRHAIVALYIAFAVTVILVLQVLELQGRLP
jgi:hypothetical protein